MKKLKFKAEKSTKLKFQSAKAKGKGKPKKEEVEILTCDACEKEFNADENEADRFGNVVCPSCFKNQYDPKYPFKEDTK